MRRSHPAPLLTALVGLLLVAPRLAAQTLLAQTTRVGSCDPRIDVCGLPAGGGALHYIDASGSYRLGCNIQVGPGQRGIAIGPNASSVTIDGEGFSILGDASHTALEGITCVASPVQRDSIRLGQMAMEDFVGAAISIGNVHTVQIEGVDIRRSYPGIIISDTDGCQIAGSSVIQCATGIVVTAVDAFEARGCVLIGNGIGATVCGHSTQFEDVVVQGGTSGLAFDDACFAPGGVEPFALRLSAVRVEDVAQAGITVTGTQARKRWIEVIIYSRIEGCGSDGITIAIPEGHALTLDGTTSSNNAGAGLSVVGANSGAFRADCRDSFMDGNGGDGIHVDVGGDCAMSLSGGSSSRNGGDGLDVDARSAPNLTMKGSKILQNLGRGGSIVAESVDLFVKDSSFSDNGLRGLQVAVISGPGGGGGGSVRMESSVLRGNGGDGCDVDCTALPVRGSASITNTQCTGNTGNGLALHGMGATLQGVECSSNSSRGYYGDRGLQNQLNDVRCNANGGDGIGLADTGAELRSCVAAGNGGDGVHASGALPGVPSGLRALQCAFSDNQGLGMRIDDDAPARVEATAFDRNVTGGLSLDATCASCDCSVTSSRFSANGGAAIALLRARGGRVSDCVVSGSPTGIRVGDPSLPGGCTGVRVSDNTVSSCGAGLVVEANGHHVVVRNMATSCTVSYSLAGGNMSSPVVTGSDPGTNPNSNLAP